MDELTFDPQGFTAADTTTEIEGYENHVEQLENLNPEQDFRTPAEVATQESVEQPQQTEQPQQPVQPTALEQTEQQEVLQPEVVERRDQNRFVEYEELDDDGDVRLRPAYLDQAGLDKGLQKAHNLTYSYIPEEGQIAKEYKENGGDTNLQNVKNTFLKIAGNPRLVKRYDRNGDGLFTISDWFDATRYPMSPEEDLAATQKWLNDIDNPTLGTRIASVWDRVGNANMWHFTHQRRLAEIGPQGSFWAGQGGEQVRATIRGGALDTVRMGFSIPEKIQAGFENREDGQFFNMDAAAEHDAVLDDALFPVSNPMSYGYSVNNPVKRFWSDPITYEVGRYLPAIVATAPMPGALTQVTFTKGLTPFLTTGARGIAVTWATETIPTNLFADFTHKGMGEFYDENKWLKRFAEKHPEIYVGGTQLAHWVDTPTGRLLSNMTEELGLDAVGLLGVQGILKGAGWGLGQTTGGVRRGLGNLRFPQKNMDKSLPISTKPHSSRSYTKLNGPEELLDQRIQKQSDNAEAALDQQNIGAEGPSSRWRDWTATEAELNTTYAPNKNGRISQGQGNVPRRGDVLDITNQSDELNNQVGFDSGTVDELFTPTQKAGFAKNGIPDPWFVDNAARYWNDPRLKEQIDWLNPTSRKLGDYGENTLKNTQEIIGRDAASQTPREFWGDNLVDQPLRPGNFDSLSKVQKFIVEKLTVQDAVNQSLLKKLRDTANAAGELIGKSDIFAVEGPMKRIADNLVLGLSNVKKTQFTWDLAAKKMKAQGGELTEEMIDEINQIVATRSDELLSETQDGVRLMMRLMKNSESEDLAEHILDVFKVSNDIHNWKDFDAWMRQKIKGGEFNGKVKTGALIHELQGVMVNSILSGPKTPLRAILGTTTNAYLNALNEAAGAMLRSPFTKDMASRKASIAKFKGMIELIPESLQVFRKNFKAKWNANLSDIRTRYSEAPTGHDQNWNLYAQWTERNGTAGDKAAFYIANIARNLNNNKLLSWSPRALAATDDTFKWLLARARSKEIGMRQALEVAEDTHTKFSPELMKKAEDIHMKNLLDAEGNIDLRNDAWLEKQFKEVTLTSELKGFSANLDQLFNSTPLMKPFYLFARTGVNGLNLAFKNTPLLGALHKESLDILKHTGDDFTPLFKYGIENANDLANARNLFAGRQAVGAGVVMTMGGMYAAGQLTGNGPADRQLKQQWINAGWKPNHLYIGDLGFDYTSLEPYNTIFSSIADIGDNLELMGSEWAEKRLQAVAFVLGRGLTSKTYMSGLDQLMQVIQMKPGALNKAGANVLNNSIPLAGLRNEFGKWVNPHMSELNGSMWDSIRNRNKATELIAAEPLPEKSDLLNGKPIRNWNLIGRSFNAVSPIQLDIRNDTPGRKLLLDSNYDLKSTTYSYGGYSFVNDNHVRAHFQNAIGTVPITVGFKKFKNVEEALNYLATRSDVKSSMSQMKANGKNPALWDVDPNDYPHNTLIDNVMEQARAKAWAKINNPNHPGYPRLQKLKAEKDGHTARTRSTRSELLELNYPTNKVEQFPQ